MDSMVVLADPQAETVAAYLAAHFPKNEQRAPTLVDGDFEIEIREWLVPTLGQRSRDPIEAPDGSIWWTGMWASIAGRLDPATGALDEIDTRARPYGIKVASDGRVWIAYNGTNALGSMDPDTMAVRYYEVPHEASRIRRLDLSSDGQVWYVNSTRGRIGRLDPATGGIREWDSPSGPSSHPYALAVIDDVVWYNESGMRPDALVRFDPDTERFQSWAIPSGVGIVRHVWVTEDRNLLIHQSSSNRIGRVTIPSP